MSQFTSVSSPVAKKKWADSESESEDSVREDVVPLANENAQQDKEVEEEEESSSSSSESETEDSKLDVSRIRGTADQLTSKKEKNSKASSLNLSKKERQELRKKELEDLDSILEEMGMSAIKQQEVLVVQQPLQSSISELEDSNTNKANKDKKKKKKKVSTTTTADEIATNALTTNQSTDSSSSITIAENVSATSAPSPADVSNILKARLKKSSASKTPAVTNAQKIALEEATKAAKDSKNKKKKDKSRFSEYSY